ncbi:DmsC/YnfH family molybdoenzyme membrane anchor subunit [Dermatobacter hominis]|uniref:DmsC/YnfH family molybdoenzyme membrane anchor subunit n=1 Tax=Dermatobacter hominis TaxID=2884263 RepID=UPI001D0FCB88|nr:DmsC/YnfH family molybdoenzyme membrane anchor subunit [Dermatobacter hominis]UDY35154.1 dimethyl sulfoxide reductase anchor subunit [Dermatobacter hominis]
MRTLDARSAVERFDDWHDDHEARSVAGARYERALPASPPAPGSQYRFEVDLDRCSGCKACVSACHSLNGLDGGETWRSVGLLVGGGDAAPVWQQHVTTACHHCLEPACLAGCPVDAYEKDPVTGIVAHLDDQCIGCRYCMLTCPYEVPSFNDRLGIVRKCDMCADRLTEGEAPACVQGCPTEAISIGVVDTAELAASLTVDADERLVPTAPRSGLSSPTTVYLTSRPVPDDAVAADDHRVVPATGHPPLVAMLVLTQVSVGAVVLGEAMALGADPVADAGRPAGPAVVAWSVAMVAILASVLHLGRPGVAWRALLGVGHSWLSREILAFGVYAALGGAAALAATGGVPGPLATTLGVLTAVSGVAGVACSAQLYAVTGRALWRLDRTLLRFVVTMGVGGAAALGAVVAVASALGAEGWRADQVRATSTAVVVASTAAGLLGVASFQRRHRGRPGQLGRSVLLLDGPLRRDRRRGIVLAVAAAAVAVAALATAPGSTASAWCWLLVAALAVAASWVERHLFFVAVAPDRMPGGLR